MPNPEIETAKHITDGLSVVTAVGTLAGLLPAVAAVFTIIWTAIRIYETETVQKLIRGDKDDGLRD